MKALAVFAGVVVWLAGAADGHAANRTPFLLGADVSLATEIERAGVVFKDDGRPTDIFAGDHVFATRAEAKSALFSSSEIFYNRVWLHGALGFDSPVGFAHRPN